MTGNWGRSPISGKWGRSPISGFTLIEVLAALVIVALGMLGAITAVNQSVRNGTYLRDKTLAHWIAMNVLTERRIQTSPPDTSETSGDLEFANERWHWTLKVTQTQVRSMRRMDVAVRLASAPETSSLASVSGFYGTAISTAGGSGDLSWAGSNAQGNGQADDEEEPGADGDNNSGGGGKNTGKPPGRPSEREPDRLPDDMEE